jgi:hypothetical protein
MPRERKRILDRVAMVLPFGKAFGLLATDARKSVQACGV